LLGILEIGLHGLGVCVPVEEGAWSFVIVDQTAVGEADFVDVSHVVNWFEGKMDSG
jgi:hypothetical protein